MELKNTPLVKPGIVAVSRDCFPIELSKKRLAAVLEECRKIKFDVVACSVVIENEKDALKAAEEMRQKGVNAVTVYLGNFGPEGPETIFAQKLGAPFMLVGAAEETSTDLINGRGDAYCGMLNASLNTGLRGLSPHIPQMPILLPEGVAKEMEYFSGVARVLLGLRGLKVFGFGPRPQDFYACDAPIKPLYRLGIEVMENSELDLFIEYKKAASRTGEIDAIVKDMERELGTGNKHPEKLKQLAQFEIALTSFYEANLGSRQFGVFADKCWPSFEPQFEFVPCYVNGRMAARGIPVACETDIYGAISEYIVQCASNHPVTLLDINNTVPADLQIADTKGASREDLFMGFHCGNTATCLLCEGCGMKYQLIMNRLMEPGKTPNITVGTLEGTLRPGPVTVFRFNADRNSQVQSYMADGEVPQHDPKTFGGVGVIACKGFARFYRHILVEKQFPHHAAVAFKNCGRILWDAMKVLGVPAYAPLPAGTLYPSENPFLPGK